MTYQTVSTAAHSFRVENVEWKVHGAHVHVQYTPPGKYNISGKEISDSDIFVFETGLYVAQADLKLAMCLHFPSRTTGVPVFDVLDDQIQCLTHTYGTVPSEL